jgi:uncharacterized protein YcbK (DUF882 family)
MNTTQVALSRRHFLLAGLATGLSLNPINSLAALTPLSPHERTLSLYNQHTSEQVNICYYSEGAYQKDSLNTLNRLLRDHRTDESYNMDIQLLDMLNIIQSRLDTHRPFHIISGYRSQKTNNMLRKRSGKVAKKSYQKLPYAGSCSGCQFTREIV